MAKNALSKMWAICEYQETMNNGKKTGAAKNLMSQVWNAFAVSMHRSGLYEQNPVQLLTSVLY